jgi:predicted transposase YbfD/YdcC
LLKKLERKGANITMDAMGIQKDVAAQIVDGRSSGGGATLTTG